MGSKSRQLRLRDLRAIYRLIRECRDRGWDSQVWHTHLITRLCQLVDAQSGSVVESVGSDPRSVQIVGSLTAGWPDPEAEAVWRRFLAEEQWDADPMYDRVTQLLVSQSRELITRARHQVISDDEWRGSRHFNEYRKLAGTNECLYSYRVVPGQTPPRMYCIELYRDLNDRPFNARERRFVHWLHHEIAVLLGRQLAWLHEPAPSALSPRLRQTLDCLLSGNGEQQVAARLGLSQGTVHQYVVSLYRFFGVSSRAELLAYFLRRNRVTLAVFQSAIFGI